jgi:hypothetical protein
LSIYCEGEFFKFIYLFSEMHIRVYNAPLNNKDFFLLADDWGASGAEANGVRVW